MTQTSSLCLGTDGNLYDGVGRRFDPDSRRWHTPAPGPVGMSAPITLAAAVHWLQTSSGRPLRAPIGVIGPRDATPEQLDAARRVGEGLGAMRLTVVCGGRHGVMQSVAEGVQAAGGVSIGLLPDATPELANPFLTHVIATGLGEARNAVVARSAFCLVAIGDSYGTLSEVALGRQFGKAVLGLAGAARVDGVVHYDEPAPALDAVAALVLGLVPE